MADIKLNVGIDVSPGTLRRLQQRLVESIGNISPTLEVKINEKDLRARATKGVQDIAAKVARFDISAGAKKSIRRAVSEALDGIVVKNIKFDQANLKALEGQLRQQLADLEVAQKQKRSAPEGLSGLGLARRGAVNEEIAKLESDIARTLQAIDKEKTLQRKFEEKVTAERQKAAILAGKDAQRAARDAIKAGERAVADAQREKEGTERANAKLAKERFENNRKSLEEEKRTMARVIAALNEQIQFVEGVNPVIGKVLTEQKGVLAAVNKLRKSLEGGALVTQTGGLDVKQGVPLSREPVEADLAKRARVKIAAIQDNESKLLLERLGIIRSQNEIRGRELSEAQKNFGIVQEANRLGQNLNEVLRKRVKQFAASEGGPGAGNAVTFRGAADVQRFASTLSPDQLSGFIKALTDINTATSTTGRSIDTFMKDLRRGDSAVERIRSTLSGANQAAFDFGVRISQTARRFLEWATPATFIFSTISRLRAAVDTVIDLDREARRLEFFKATGAPIESTNKSIQSFGQFIKNSSQNLDAFFAISSKTGIAMKDVAQALTTVARIGVNVDSVIRSAAAGGEILNRSFTGTVLRIVNLEAGAISAEKATTRLRAIQAQLIDTLDLTPEAAERAAANIGDLLVSAAGRTSFSVDELSSAVARLGTSFNQIQGTNIPAIIETIATAAKLTGAEVGRLATTFRQLTTQVVRNAERLQRGFNIQIIDPKTNQATFEGILSFLREVNRLSQGGAQQGRLLASLGTDQRNVNEVKQLAVGVAALEKEFGTLSSTQAQLGLAARAAREAFLGSEAITDSLRGKLNALDAEFAKLTKEFLASNLFTGFVSGMRSAVEGTTQFIKAVEEARPTLNALLALLTIKFGPKILSALAGLGAGLRDTFTGASSKTEIKGLLGRQETAIDGINKAQADGFLTAKQAKELRDKETVAVSRQIVATSKLRTLESEIAVEKAKTVQNVDKLISLEARRAHAQNQVNAAIAQENTLRTRTIQQLETTNQKLLQNNTTLAALGGLLALGGTFGLGELATSLRKEGQQAVAAGVEKGATTGILGAVAGAFAGGKLGALVGAVGGPLGTALGATIGAGISFALGASSGMDDELKKINAEAKKQFQASREADAARAAQLEIIEAQERRIARTAENRIAEEQRVLNLRLEIQRLQNAPEPGTAEQRLIRIAELGKLSQQLNEATNKLEDKRLEIQARQILAQEQLNKLRRDEQALLGSTELLLTSLTTGVKEELTIPLRISFETSKIATEIANINKQIAKERERQETDEIKVNVQALSESKQKVLDLQAQQNALRQKQITTEIQLQKQLQDRQANLFSESFRNLEGANESFVRSLDAVFQAQLRIADSIIQAGDVASRQLTERGKDFIESLGVSGQNIAVRLNAVIRQTNTELAQVALNRQLAAEALSRTGVQAFTGLDDINAGLREVSKALLSFANRGSRKIFDEVTGQFEVDLFLGQERARIARQEFNARIQQTRQELSLRQNILQQEIGILQERLRAERQLRDLRIEQQREFGRLLLQGPEEFNKAISQLTVAEGFFKGLGDINLESLRGIERRLVTLRSSGQFETLKAVQAGLQTAVRTGAPRVFGGVSNEEALRIIEQLSTSGLPGGTKAEDVFLQLKQQRDDQARQLSVQEAIRERQEALQDAAFRQAELQAVEARLAQEDLNASIAQRNTLITEAQKRLSELIQIRVTLQQFLTKGIKIARETAPTGSSLGASVISGFLKDAFAAAGLSPTGKPTAKPTPIPVIPTTRPGAPTPSPNGIPGGGVGVKLGLGGLGAEAVKLTEKFKQLSGGITSLDAALGGKKGTASLPSIRQTDAFNRTLQDILSGLKFGERGVSFAPVKALRETIEDPDLSPTLRRRRLQELQKQTKDFGTVLAPEKLARFFVSDRLRARGTETGFRQLLQGETPLVKRLRTLADLQGGGTEVSGRRARELNVKRLTELLRESGLTGVAGGIKGQDDAAKIVSQLLKLSESFQRNQTELTAEQSRLIVEVLTRELKPLAEAAKSFKERVALEPAERKPGETPEQFAQRLDQQRAKDVAAATAAAVFEVGDKVFANTVDRIGEVIGTQIAAVDSQRQQQLNEFATKINNVAIKFTDDVKVKLEAAIQQTLKIDENFIETLRRTFPNLSQEQLQQLVNDVAKLVKVERGRGTPEFQGGR